MARRAPERRRGGVSKRERVSRRGWLVKLVVVGVVVLLLLSSLIALIAH